METARVNSSWDVVLLTGGAGSLGNELTRVLLKNTDAIIRILDINEYNLDRLMGRFNKDDRIRPLVGDIRDEKRLKRAVEDVAVVYHLAALKHVWMGEYSPKEVLQTNVVGTQNVIDAVLDEKNVKECMYCSSDKAVNPSNFYGQSKAMSEGLIIKANNMKGDRKTAFSVYRPGNFFMSSGSVIEKWVRQKENGEPITVTEGGMSRYFIGIGRAAELLYDSSLRAIGGEIFIPKMKAYSIDELADLFGGEKKSQSPIRGEKTTEELYSQYEAGFLTDEGDLLVIRVA